MFHAINIMYSYVPLTVRYFSLITFLWAINTEDLFQGRSYKLYTQGINHSWSYIAVWQKPERKCDQNTRGRCAPEGVLVTFSRGFSSDGNIWPGMINPDYDIFVYNNIFNYLSWIILILPQITGFSTSRWEDKVTATKIRGSSTLTKTLPRGCSRVD